MLKDIVEGFSSGSGKAYDAVKDKLQLLGKQIDDYVVYSQVQLNVSGGKMVADQVLVKYDMLGEIEDVEVLENKLKDITDYTTRQKSG